MAKIWPWRKGSCPTPPNPIAEKPLKWCIEKLGIEKSQWHSEPIIETSKRPDLDAVRPFEKVVVETEDASLPGWKAGYYPSALSLKTVQKMIKQDSN